MTIQLLRRWAGGTAILAGILHGGLAPSHFQEWWGYGLFFLAAGLVQVVGGLAVLTDAIEPKTWGPGWIRARTTLYYGLALLHLLLILLYILTRTYGIPLLGPEAGQVEEVAPFDLAVKAIEAASTILLVVLARRHKAMAMDTTAGTPKTP